MKAYQMIYTACGKDKSGAFSVWSKSANVTKKECDEIIKLMNYRKPQNVPYEPTEEELETMFPKKYGYFELSSGRRCVAQSSYIGKVYSDMDSRSGNFIIHAYIFDSVNEFNPYYIFNGKFFKTKLSYKEWHDDPLIEDLPAVEIETSAVPAESEIKSTVSEYGSIFPAFLEAVLKSRENDKFVYFNDTEANQIRLYKAIGTLLPITALEGLTFSTQYSVQAEYSLQSLGAVPVRIRNVFENTAGAQFSYDGEIESGNYGFEFQRKIFGKALKTGRYVQDILNDLNTLRYFDVIKKVDFISDILARAKCGVEMANAVYNLYAKNYGWFTDLSELNAAVSVAVSVGCVKSGEMAADIYKNFVKSGKSNAAPALLPLVKTAYGFSDNNLKEEIIAWFYEFSDDFIQNNGSVQTYLVGFKEKSPFPWEDFIHSVLYTSKWENIINGLKDFNKVYLFYDVLVKALAENQGDNRAISSEIITIVKKIIASGSATELKTLFEASRILGASFEKWLMDYAVNSIFNPVSNENELCFGFEIINALADAGVQAASLEKFLLANINSPLLIPVYVRYSEAGNGLYARLEKGFTAKREFDNFVARKEAYLFNKETKVTQKMLDSYFSKFYVAGYDSGIYLSKLKGYLGGLQTKEKISEVFRQYNQIRNMDDTFSDVVPLVAMLEKQIYSVSLDELLSLGYPQFEIIAEMDLRLKRNKQVTSGKFEILYALFLLTGKMGGKTLEDAVQKNEIYRRMSQEQTRYMMENHSDIVLTAYFKLRRDKKFGSSLLLESIFGYPFVALNIAGGLSPYIEKLNDKDYYDLMSEFFAYAFNQKNDFATALRRFIRAYVDDMKRGEYKKLFKKVQNTVDEESLKAVTQFIDDYLDNHKGIFDSLFGRKKNGGKKE